MQLLIRRPYIERSGAHRGAVRRAVQDLQRPLRQRGPEAQVLQPDGLPGVQQDIAAEVRGEVVGSRRELKRLQRGPAQIVRDDRLAGRAGRAGEHEDHSSLAQRPTGVVRELGHHQPTLAPEPFGRNRVERDPGAGAPDLKGGRGRGGREAPIPREGHAHLARPRLAEERKLHRGAPVGAGQRPAALGSDRKGHGLRLDGRDAVRLRQGGRKGGARAIGAGGRAAHAELRPVPPAERRIDVRDVQGAEVGVGGHHPHAVHGLHHVAQFVGRRPLQVQPPGPEGRVVQVLRQVQRGPGSGEGPGQAGVGHPNLLHTGGGIAHHAQAEVHAGGVRLGEDAREGRRRRQPRPVAPGLLQVVAVVEAEGHAVVGAEGAGGAQRSVGEEELRRDDVQRGESGGRIRQGIEVVHAPGRDGIVDVRQERGMRAADLGRRRAAQRDLVRDRVEAALAEADAAQHAVRRGDVHDLQRQGRLSRVADKAAVALQIEDLHRLVWIVGAVFELGALGQIREDSQVGVGQPQRCAGAAAKSTGWMGAEGEGGESRAPGMSKRSMGSPKMADSIRAFSCSGRS